LSANLGENKAIEEGRSGSGPRKARKSAGQRSGFLRSDRCRSWLILHFIWHFYEQLQPSPNLHFSKSPTALLFYHLPLFICFISGFLFFKMLRFRLLWFRVSLFGMFLCHLSSCHTQQQGHCEKSFLNFENIFNFFYKKLDIIIWWKNTLNIYFVINIILKYFANWFGIILLSYNTRLKCLK